MMKTEASRQPHELYAERRALRQIWSAAENFPDSNALLEIKESVPFLYYYPAAQHVLEPPADKNVAFLAFDLLDSK